MAQDDDEERLLRTVALRNAESVLLARQRAEEDLVRAKEALELKTQELARSLAMMRATLESTTDGILVTDGRGKVTGFNEKFVQMWGIPADIMSSREHRRLLEVTSQFFNDAAQFLSRVEYIYASSPPESYDLLERADGRVFERFSRIQFVDEQNAGRVWSFRDITERRRAEDDLLKIAADLSEADRRKNEFLAMLAHELRNPLAPIRNALEILRAKGDDAEVVDRTSQMMYRQVGQMARLVDDLLDLSRISVGKIELRSQEIDLAAVAHHAVESALARYEDKGHEFTVTVPPEPIYLTGDPTRLTQVIGNLLSNACKFTAKGGRIRLILSQEGDQAVVRVSDNGIGIAGDQLSRIFEMFTQLDTAVERSQSGLGIGLTLVKELVELHGGSVAAYSAGVGLGSELVVRLPILTHQPARRPPLELPGGRKGAAVPQRILVVDDNRDAAESLGILLELAGHQIRIAHDGLEAVEVATTFLPHTILLDIGLPKLNGHEAARRIREQPWGKDMVLVALTGWGQHEDRRRSTEAGFDSHLVKPVDLDALMKLLSQRQLQRSEVS